MNLSEINQCNQQHGNDAEFGFTGSFNGCYFRSTKSHLRCFPHCHPSGHCEKGYCGSAVRGCLMVRKPMSIEDVVVVAEVCVFGPHGPICNELISESEIHQSQIVRDVQYYIGKPVSHIENEDENVYDIQFEMRPWFVNLAGMDVSSSIFSFVVTVYSPQVINSRSRLVKLQRHSSAPFSLNRLCTSRSNKTSRSSTCNNRMNGDDADSYQYVCLETRKKRTRPMLLDSDSEADCEPAQSQRSKSRKRESSLCSSELKSLDLSAEYSSSRQTRCFTFRSDDSKHTSRRRNLPLPTTISKNLDAEEFSESEDCTEEAALDVEQLPKVMDFDW